MDFSKVTFKGGDLVTIKIDDMDAINLNNMGMSHWNRRQIVKHEPFQFDWSTVAWGMAFESEQYPLFHYVARDMEGNAVFDFSHSGKPYQYGVFGNDDLLKTLNFRRIEEKDLIQPYTKDPTN